MRGNEKRRFQYTSRGKFEYLMIRNIFARLCLLFWSTDSISIFTTFYNKFARRVDIKLLLLQQQI